LRLARIVVLCREEEFEESKVREEVVLKHLFNLGHRDLCSFSVFFDVESRCPFNLVPIDPFEPPSDDSQLAQFPRKSFIARNDEEFRGHFVRILESVWIAVFVVLWSRTPLGPIAKETDPVEQERFERRCRESDEESVFWGR
jgi:hypothetical protein